MTVKDHLAVRKVLEEAGNVKLCLAGHDHPGLFHEDEHRIHYWTDQACLFCLGEPEVAGLVLRLFADRAEIQKLNDDTVHLVPYSPMQPAADSAEVGKGASKGAGKHKQERRHHTGARIPMVFDMEPGADPDDVLTLLFLAAHPNVDLKAVTLSSKGEGNSVDLVRWILKKVGLENVRVGAEDWPKNMNLVCQSVANDAFFRENFGEAKTFKTSESDCEDAKLVLLEECDDQTTLVTGGPLTNLAAALEMDAFRLGRLVAQGGFAGDGVVPKELQKVKKLHAEGQRYFHTTNFGLDPEAAHKALASEKIGHRICVSKNVCHQTLYDNSAQGWHGLVKEAVKATNQKMGPQSVRFKALDLMANAMTNYLKGNPRGKKLHDPLALAVALDHSVCTLAEVTLDSREKGKAWGSSLSPESGTWISIDYDEGKFRKTLLQLDAASGSDEKTGKQKSKKK